ncbi:hypothetical protein HS088_TW15G00588 [Tripterygium wilfordii]|uniref:Uncharacterized protein n=1 Tax=Tripterygium wilfordii TaxID=458696 RepID=A0A7J7CM31_TRIWF|nr:hypothetical protein HS088_TW15G00588 [Tripterygium wilfordii]
MFPYLGRKAPKVDLKYLQAVNSDQKCIDLWPSSCVLWTWRIVKERTAMEHWPSPISRYSYNDPAYERIDRHT